MDFGVAEDVLPNSREFWSSGLRRAGDATCRRSSAGGVDHSGDAAAVRRIGAAPFCRWRRTGLVRALGRGIDRAGIRARRLRSGSRSQRRFRRAASAGATQVILPVASQRLFRACSAWYWLSQRSQEGDGGAEVVVERHEQVDVVEVLLAAEAVGEVVAWIDGGAHLAAAGTEEAEVAFAHLRRRPVAAEGGDGDRHRQVVADAAQQVVGNHEKKRCQDPFWFAEERLEKRVLTPLPRPRRHPGFSDSRYRSSDRPNASLLTFFASPTSSPPLSSVQLSSSRTSEPPSSRRTSSSSPRP